MSGTSVARTPFGTLATAIAIAWIVYAVAVVLHEAAHYVAGLLVGGTPTLLSTTDLRGTWAGVSAAGMVAIGASGSAVNVVLAAAGWLLARSRPRSAALRWLAWLLVAVNGFLVGLYMIVSPALDFGDWNTILRSFPWHTALRVVFVAIGVVATLRCFRLVRRLAAGAVPGLAAGWGAPLVRIAWLAAGTLAVAAALLSPLGWRWAIPLSIGSTLGTTWPMLIAARAAAREAAPDDGATLRASPAWIAAGCVTAAVFVFVFGPGVRF